MRKFLAIAACVALSGCSTFDWPEIRSLVMFGDEVVTTDAEQALAQGRENFALGNYGIAVDSFHAAVTFDPDSVRAFNGLAASYDKLGRFDGACRVGHFQLVARTNARGSGSGACVLRHWQ